MFNFNTNAVEIEDYVEGIARKSRVESFYPQAISRKLNIPIELVLIELEKLIPVGKIFIRYEIKCLEDSNTICTVNDYKDSLGKKLFCEICGKDITINYNNIYPVYYINEEYKEYLKKKVIK